MERMLSRIPSKKINPREVMQLGHGLYEIFTYSRTYVENIQNHI